MESNDLRVFPLLLYALLIGRREYGRRGGKGEGLKEGGERGDGGPVTIYLYTTDLEVLRTKGLKKVGGGLISLPFPIPISCFPPTWANGNDDKRGKRKEKEKKGKERKEGRHGDAPRAFTTSPVLWPAQPKRHPQPPDAHISFSIFSSGSRRWAEEGGKRKEKKTYVGRKKKRKEDGRRIAKAMCARFLLCPSSRRLPLIVAQSPPPEREARKKKKKESSGRKKKRKERGGKRPRPRHASSLPRLPWGLENEKREF